MKQRHAEVELPSLSQKARFKTKFQILNQRTVSSSDPHAHCVSAVNLMSWADIITEYLHASQF